LRKLEAESVQCVITSPPYWGLRSYQTEPQIWGGSEGCQHEWGDGIKSAAGQGGYSDKQHSNRGSRFEITDSNFCSRCGAWRGELGLEPTPDCGRPKVMLRDDLTEEERERVMSELRELGQIPTHLRKYFEVALCGQCYVCHIVAVFREVRRVLRKDGTCFINLGDSYAGSGRHSSDTRGGDTTLNKAMLDLKPMSVDGLKPKDLCGIPWRVAFALQADGWWLRSDIIWSKPNPMPESVTDRPTRSHEYIFLLTKSARYFYDVEAVREPYEGLGKPRAFAAKGNKDRNDTGRMYEALDQGGRNLRSVWSFPTQAFKGAHFATFPEELVERCIMAGTAAQACPKCGAAWVRVVEKTKTTATPNMSDSRKEQIGKDSTCIYPVRYEVQTSTLGFRPSCDCSENTGEGRCVVLDPFGGASTTAVVAEKLGRNWIMIELKPDYIKMSQKRLRGVTRGMF